MSERDPGTYVVRDLVTNPWWRDFFEAVLRLCDAAPPRCSIDEDFVRRAIGDLKDTHPS